MGSIVNVISKETDQNRIQISYNRFKELKNDCTDNLTEMICMQVLHELHVRAKELKFDVTEFYKELHP